MKKRFIYIFLSGVLIIGSLTNCGSKDSTRTATTDSIYGEVTKISSKKIIIKLAEEPKKGVEGEKEQDSDEKGESGGNGAVTPKGMDLPDGQTPPDKPDGNQGDSGEGRPDSLLNFIGEKETVTVTKNTTVKKQERPDSTEDGSLEDIEKGSIVSVQLEGDTAETITVQSIGSAGTGGEGGPGNPGEGEADGMQSESSTGSIALKGAYTVDGTEETSNGETKESTASDENTVLVTNGGSLAITNANLSKNGDTSNMDESNFYGVNGVVTTAQGSATKITGGTITSDGEGANAIFSTGEGTTVTADQMTINTAGNSSRGIDATYGGTINATNMNITTKGAHCAPVATDRGEGNVSIDTSTLSAAGEGSPCIYSTGIITAKNITGTASGSQTAVVEGKNSITLEKSNLTGAGENGVMLYQSTSGDAGEGTARFTAVDSSLTTTSNGAMFYVTNTKAKAVLSNTTLTFPSGILVEAAGNTTNNWGIPGSNGATFTLKGVNQVLKGNITCDKISSVKLKLTKGTIYEGVTDKKHEGKVSVSLDKTSKWTLTGDCYVEALTNEDSSCANIISNGHTIYYNADNEANNWLNGSTLTTKDGGSICPMN